jgi:hypothetical protein
MGATRPGPALSIFLDIEHEIFELFFLRFASSFVPSSRTMADKSARRVHWRLLGILFLGGFSRRRRGHVSQIQAANRDAESSQESTRQQLAAAKPNGFAVLIRCVGGIWIWALHRMKSGGLSA